MRASFLLPALYAAVYASGSPSSASGAASSTAAASAAATSDVLGGGDLSGPCFPRRADGKLDPAAPCHMVQTLSLKCATLAAGVAGNVTRKREVDDLIARAELEAPDAMVSDLKVRGFNDTLNQECYCEAGQPGAAFWENVQGCVECRRLHGIRADWVPAQLVPELSSSYCAIASPTGNLGAYLTQFLKSASTPAIGTSTPTDVLGTSTAVSLYFTSTAIATAVATTGSAASGSTASGTAASGTAASGSVAATGSTTGASSGAGVPAVTQAPVALVAGVLGLVALL